MEALRVLIADDEAGMRLAVARALERFTVGLPGSDAPVGFAVEGAETGEEALAKVAASPPDLLLLDYKLPGMTGLDVLERLGPDADLRTIVITAYASIETAVTATKRGAFDFLPKPFTPEELKAVVRKAAGHLALARHAAALAREKRQARFQMISVVAHELKAPLGAVEQYVRLARDRAAGEDLSAYDPMFDRCLARIEGMRKLIVDLLDLTRIESGTQKREVAPLDLAAVLAAAVETARALGAPRGIAVSLRAPASVPFVADRAEIEIVANNLLSNAVKYNVDGGRVDATLADGGGAVVLAVADTGIGIRDADRGRLFGEFVRLRNERTKDILGSGLGLSIVRKIVALYGGTVDVASREGAGSTFTVTLPRKGRA